MLRKEFAGKILLQEERLSANISVGLQLNEDGVKAETLAEVDICLNLPDSSIFHFDGFFTRKLLTKATNILNAVANGELNTDEIYDYDLIYFNLKFDSVPNDETHVVVSGRFYSIRDDTNVSPRWKGIITQHDIEAYPEESLRGLLLARSDVGVMASLFREFLDLAGEALPEKSAYDNN